MTFTLSPIQKIIRKVLFSVGICALFNTGLSGQGDCSTTLQEAQKYYDLGMIDEIPKMLAGCMEDGFSRGDKIEAYKLIILSYLFDDKQFEAEKTMVEFLKKFPEYEIMPNDPIEFVYLFESYRTAAVYSFGITAGFNLTDPRIMEPYSAFNVPGTVFSNNMKAGYNFGIGASRYINKHILLSLECYFTSNKYSFSDALSVPLNGINPGVTSLTYTEKLNKIEIPITASYEIVFRKLHYYLRAGISAAKVTRVSGEPTLRYSESNSVALRTLSGESQDMNSYRRNMLYSGIIGVGIGYNVPRGVLMFDVRYKLGLNNLVVSNKRYNNQNLINRFYYIDDDFTLNTLSFTASYYFSFYTPKKQH
jgi:hypothetical protein